MSTITVSSAVATSSKNISDAVLEYMTSLKSVRKRDGSEQPFSYEKLSASLSQAMKEVGVRDAYWVSRVLEQVMSRLVRTFDGHTVPTTNDIREVITATLIDNNLSHVVKKYTGFRMERSANAGEPVYGNGITIKRYFTKEGKHPYEFLTWQKRTAKITNEKGGVVFETKYYRTIEMASPSGSQAPAVIVPVVLRDR